MGLMEIHWRITISGNGTDVVSHRTCGTSTGHCMWICWKLLSNQNFKGPYLSGRGDHGVARVSRPATSNKIVTVYDPNWDAFANAAHASQLGSCNYKYMYVLYMHTSIRRDILYMYMCIQCTYSVGRVTGVVVVV